MLVKVKRARPLMPDTKDKPADFFVSRRGAVAAIAPEG